MNSLVTALSRINLTNSVLLRPVMVNAPVFSPLHTSTINHFRVTDVWSSAIVKKRRKADPASEKAKDDRRRKRLVKALKKMEKKPRQPKPVIEMEVPSVLLEEAAIRTRNVLVPLEVSEERHYFMKDWANYSYNRHRNELYELDRKIVAQQEALDQLRLESMDLYLEACKFDPALVPFSAMGPTSTPPITNYIQDGEYKDVTREYKVVYEDTEAFLKKLVTKIRRRKQKDNYDED